MVEKAIRVALYLVCLSRLAQASYKTYYMQNYCSGSTTATIRLNETGEGSAVIIRAFQSSYSAWQAGLLDYRSCQLRIQPAYQESDSEREDAKDFGLVLSIKSVNLRTQGGICIDSLTIKRQKWGKWIDGLEGCTSTALDGLTLVTEVQPYQRDLLIQFNISNTGLMPEDKGFELTVTSFAAKKMNGCPTLMTRNQPAGWFQCSSAPRCVWQGLTCDGRNNCGDDSDEWQDEGAKCVADVPSAMIATVVSLSVVIVITALVICCCCRRRTLKNCGRSDVDPSAPPSDQSDSQPILANRQPVTQYSSNSQISPPPYNNQTPFEPPPPYRE